MLEGQLTPLKNHGSPWSSTLVADRILATGMLSRPKSWQDLGLLPNASGVRSSSGLWMDK